MKIELRADFTAIQEDRVESPKYHEGELIFQDANGVSKKLSVKIMVRGHFRLDPENCNFPPLYIDFKKSEVKRTIFDKQTRLKLVTPCQDEEDVLEEYTVYKMYNTVTDLSLQTRLVKILYFNTSNNRKIFEKFSFFIENKDNAGLRFGARENSKFLTPFSLDSENFKRLSFFEYLIGNKDWYVSSRKNIIIYQPEDTTLAPFAVPYDFDLSGVVNADYSKPEGVPEELLKSRRVYKGICYTNDELNKIFEFYRQKRSDLENTINNQNLMSKYNRNYIIKYIDYFYKVMDSRDLIKKEIFDLCETRKTYNLAEK